MALVFSNMSLLLDGQYLVVVYLFKGNLPALLLSPVIFEEFIKILILIEAVLDGITINASIIITMSHVYLRY